MTAIEIARRHIGDKETNGANRSPFIDDLCKEFGLPLGSSWCALFVSHCMKAAGAGNHFPYGAGSQRIRQWFQDKGLLTNNPDDLMHWKGALGGFTDHPDTAHGHIFLVEGRMQDAHGHVVSVKTVEGNTNNNGSANGDGCYERNRPCTNGGALWFLNTTGIPGGEWWS